MNNKLFLPLFLKLKIKVPHKLDTGSTMFYFRPFTRNKKLKLDSFKCVVFDMITVCGIKTHIIC